MKKSPITGLLALALLSFAAGAAAQDKLPAGSFAVVNGKPLSTELVDQVIRNNEAQGKKTTPEMRKLIESELAGRAALSEQAIKQGLDKTAQVKVQTELFVQNLLAESLIAEHLAKNPITETSIKADYERQTALLKDSREYKLRGIVVGDEAEAKAVLASLRKGDAFEKLAREKSIDPSKAEGGQFGWVLAEQLNPVLANVVVNLNKGATTAAPIQVGNVWHILQVQDVRAFVAPGYDAAKPKIQQALQLKQRNEFVARILSESKIELSR